MYIHLLRVERHLVGGGRGSVRSIKHDPYERSSFFTNRDHCLSVVDDYRVPSCFCRRPNTRISNSDCKGHWHPKHEGQDRYRCVSRGDRLPRKRVKSFSLRNVEIDASTMSAQVAFRDIPPGVYAVSVRHDENSNGKLDKNLLGVPGRLQQSQEKTSGS